jgi:uncharacterized damage-inducible protein DinB
MEQYYADCYDRFTDLHKQILVAIEGLDVEALDWVPAGNTNSINVLVTHLCAAERFWAADIATGRSSDRIRENEFKVSGLGNHDLVQLLDDTRQTLQDAFEQLALHDLHTIRHSAQHDMHVTTGWAILHALEHTATHLGHIQLTVQLWEE